MVHLNSALEDDVRELQASVERADAAEESLKELSKSYDELNQAFRSLALSLAPAEKTSDRPSARELAGVLNALRRLPQMPTHQQLYDEMAKDGWEEPASHRARYRVTTAGYAATVGVGLTDKGRQWLAGQAYEDKVA